MIEIYKDIPNFVGYQVSNMGNIKSYKQDKGGKILKTIVGSRGYPLINLMKGGEMFQLSVHRLVAESFVENSKNLPFVNHIDLNKENNSVENLEWVSGRENVTHYFNSTDKISKYTGVYYQKGKFCAQIHVNTKRLSLGSYDTAEEAIDAYLTGLSIFDDIGFEALLEYKSEVEDKFSSKFKCVSFDKSRGKWKASIKLNGKTVLNKRYESELLAIEAVIEVYNTNNIPLHYSHKKFLGLI